MERSGAAEEIPSSSVFFPPGILALERSNGIYEFRKGQGENEQWHTSGALGRCLFTMGRAKSMLGESG